MKVLKHFVLRDLKDSMLIWIIAAIITAIALWAGVGARAIVISPSGQQPVEVTLGYTYFFVFLIHLSQVWGGTFGRGIPREYLLSLPVSRTRMFAIMCGRSVVGLLPLLVYFWLLRGNVHRLLRVSGGQFLLGPPIQDAGFLILLLGGAWMLLAIFIAAQSTQAILVRARSQRRYLPWALYFFWLGLDMTMAASWVAAILVLEGPARPGLAAISVIYFLGKTWISYVRWMWGQDAVVWRRR